MYACHPEDDMSRVKIGFTTAEDPEKYCRTQHARTLCPLSILRISAHANGRVAEQVTHLILSSDRIDDKHEVFNLAMTRKGLNGPERLDEALNAVAKLDLLSGLPVPVAKDSRAQAEQSRKRKAVDRDELRQVIQDTKKRVREELAAKHAADKEKERFARKAATARVDSVAEWIKDNVEDATGEYLPVGRMVARFTEDYGERITSQAFKKLAVGAIGPDIELLPVKNNRRNVFAGVRFREG